MALDARDSYCIQPSGQYVAERIQRKRCGMSLETYVDIYELTILGKGLIANRIPDRRVYEPRKTFAVCEEILKVFLQ